MCALHACMSGMFGSFTIFNFKMIVSFLLPSSYTSFSISICRRRCRKYHIQGDKKGTVDDFIDNIPGFPDNIHFDGKGLFWIAFPSVTCIPNAFLSQ